MDIIGKFESIKRFDVKLLIVIMFVLLTVIVGNFMNAYFQREGKADLDRETIKVYLGQLLTDFKIAESEIAQNITSHTDINTNKLLTAMLNMSIMLAHHSSTDEDNNRMLDRVEDMLINLSISLPNSTTTTTRTTTTP